MLAIRLQRTGRKGHAHFRVVVQDARRTPTSGRYVALIGSYDPHSKSLTLDKEKADFYLKNGARPSNRVALLLQSDGVKLPEWVQLAEKKQRTTRNPEKLRKNQPAEEKPVTEETPETTDESENTEVATPEKETAEATEEASEA